MLVIPLQLWLEQKSQFEVLVIPVEASGFHGGRLRNSGWREWGWLLTRAVVSALPPPPPQPPRGPLALSSILATQERRPTNPVLIEGEETMVSFV